MANGLDRIWETARGFQASRVLLSAVELGVFEAIGESEATSAEVAAKIGADPRATDRLMDALVVLGLLIKEGELLCQRARRAGVPAVGEARLCGRRDWAHHQLVGDLVHAD